MTNPFLGKYNTIFKGASVLLPPNLIRQRFLFLWLGQFDGDDLKDYNSTDVITVNSKDFSTRYIPEASASTFNMPDNATYKTADSDNFWFTGGGVVNNITVNDIITTTAARTFIKYADSTPYNTFWIGLLKTGEVLTDNDKDQLSRYFDLWMFYFGTLNDLGVIKDNKQIP